MIERFEDIKAWQRSRKLNDKIFNATKKNPFSKDFSLKYRMLKAANSMMLNIAEGFGRRTNKEFVHYLYIAHGSAAEVQSALHIASDRKYITDKEFNKFYNETDQISKMISGLIKYFNSTIKNDYSVDEER